jgi:hypothetical protein
VSRFTRVSGTSDETSASFSIVRRGTLFVVSRRFARATDDAWCSLERESCRERVRGRLLESGGRSSFFFFSKQHFVLVRDVVSQDE